MQRCSERAFAMCPYRKACGTIHEATFTDNSDCAEFNRKVDGMPMTNADKIRAMSNKELASMIASNVTTGACNDFGIPGKKKCPNNCEECVLKWLKQPMKQERKV